MLLASIFHSVLLSPIVVPVALLFYTPFVPHFVISPRSCSTLYYFILFVRFCCISLCRLSCYLTASTALSFPTLNVDSSSLLLLSLSAFYPPCVSFSYSRLSSCFFFFVSLSLPVLFFLLSISAFVIFHYSYFAIFASFLSSLLPSFFLVPLLLCLRS